MMIAPLTSAEFNNLLLSTQAVSVWNNEKGPVFWYAAGVPGPFYVNTEKLIGGDAAKNLLEKISNVVGQPTSLAEKSAQVAQAVMAEYNRNPNFQRIIATLVANSNATFGKSFNCVSGGERRDWFFSIPFAHVLNIPHIYLFKDQQIFTHDDNVAPQSRNVLHIADLINNAASYVDNWLPTLAKHGMNMFATTCVIARGASGVDKLTALNLKTCAAKIVDLSLFKEFLNDGLISQTVFDELALYFNAREDWARKYILGKPHLLGQEILDAKSKARLKSFLVSDPWQLNLGNDPQFAALLKD